MTRLVLLLLLVACSAAAETLAPAKDGMALDMSLASIAGITWTATGGTLTPVSDTSVLYTAGSTPGLYRVIAATEGTADTSLITICTLAGTLTLNTHAATLAAPGDTMPLIATVTACNVADTSLAVTWVSRNPSVATIAGTGTQRARVTAVAAGYAWQVATRGTLTDSALVCVGGLVVDVVPSTLSLTTVTTGDLTATVKNCAASVDSTVAWISRNTGIATVASTGDRTATVTGVAAGSVYVVADEGGATDSSLVTVTTVAACTPAATHFCPSESASAMQTKITAAATGATFTFGPGTYRMTGALSPKANQVFRGTYGVPGDVILRGDRVLTGWLQSGALWYVGGQTQQNPAGFNTLCQTGRTGCSFAEELYVDGVRYERVNALSGVTAGKWYFDYTADRIYVPVNPSGKTIETSVTPYAFGGSATGWAVKHLTIQRYASARPGAVVNNDKTASVVIDSNVVRENNGVALAIRTNGIMRANQVIKSGQMGYWASGDDGLIYGNTFDSNNTAGHGPGAAGEAGAGKASNSDGLTIRRNTSRFNDGPGLWMDINNINATIDSNTVQDNGWRGIFYEISYAAVIRYNLVERNGFALPFATPGACDGAGIYVSNSPNVEVDNNTVRDNKHGICGREDDRGSGTFGPHHVTNLSVHDNVIRQLGGRAGGITDGDPAADPYSAAANNEWANNTVTCNGLTKWRWAGNLDKTKAQWLAYLQDAGSTFSGC